MFITVLVIIARCRVTGTLVNIKVIPNSNAKIRFTLKLTPFTVDIGIKN